jgi:hypothetical protein
MFDQAVNLVNIRDVVHSQASKTNPPETPFLKRRNNLILIPGMGNIDEGEIPLAERLKQLKADLLNPNRKIGESITEPKWNVDFNDKFKWKMGNATERIVGWRDLNMNQWAMSSKMKLYNMIGMSIINPGPVEKEERKRIEPFPMPKPKEAKDDNNFNLGAIANFNKRTFAAEKVELQSSLSKFDKMQMERGEK